MVVTSSARTSLRMQSLFSTLEYSLRINSDVSSPPSFQCPTTSIVAQTLTSNLSVLPMEESTILLRKFVPTETLNCKEALISTLLKIFSRVEDFRKDPLFSDLMSSRFSL